MIYVIICLILLFEKWKYMINNWKIKESF